MVVLYPVHLLDSFIYITNLAVTGDVEFKFRSDRQTKIIIAPHLKKNWKI